MVLSYAGTRSEDGLLRQARPSRLLQQGACSEVDVPQVPPLACAGARHGILPQEESPLDAFELSVCEEVRARGCVTQTV